MYAIETHLGRFEADTEKAAKALLRKAQKAQAAKESLDGANYRMAHMRAQAQAYRIMTTRSSKSGDTLFPAGWRLKPVNDGYCVQSVYVDFRTEWKINGDDHATAQSHFHGANPIEYIENGAGFCIALVFQNPKSGERIFHAVGIEADQLAVVEIPGITAEMFVKRESTAA